MANIAQPFLIRVGTKQNGHARKKSSMRAYTLNYVCLYEGMTNQLVVIYYLISLSFHVIATGLRNPKVGLFIQKSLGRPASLFKKVQGGRPLYSKTSREAGLFIQKRLAWPASLFKKSSVAELWLREVQVSLDQLQKNRNVRPPLVVKPLFKK